MTQKRSVLKTFLLHTLTHTLLNYRAYLSQLVDFLKVVFCLSNNRGAAKEAITPKNVHLCLSHALSHVI